MRGNPSLKGATPMENAQARGKHAKESQGWRLEDEENRPPGARGTHLSRVQQHPLGEINEEPGLLAWGMIDRRAGLWHSLSVELTRTSYLSTRSMPYLPSI